MEIICDDRERQVIPFMENVSCKFLIDYSVKRLEVGDYAICYKNHILIIIERKSWKDLAASITDGRKDNINKLLNLRKKTKCHIAYLIEGDPCPKEYKKFNRIPIKNLRAHLDHLAFRDNVHMIYAKKQEQTAYRLFELAKNYTTIKNPSPLVEIDNAISGGKDDTSNKEELTKKQVSTLNIQEQLIKCIPVVGSVISTLLIENNITISQLLTNNADVDVIARYKYPTGASIGLTKATKICNAYKFLTSDSKSAKKIRRRILTTIPLISKERADTILSEYSLKDIINGDVKTEDIASIKYGKSKIGQKAANNILSNLQYVDVDVNKNNINNTDNKVVNENGKVKTTKDNKVIKKKIIKKDKRRKKIKPFITETSKKKIVRYVTPMWIDENPDVSVDDYLNDVLGD